MELFKCDRCDNFVDFENDVYVIEIFSPLQDLGCYHLCENCYQTIKEVLEDGEIE